MKYTKEVALRIVAAAIAKEGFDTNVIKFRFMPQPCGTMVVFVSFQEGRKWRSTYWEVGSREMLARGPQGEVMELEENQEMPPETTEDPN